MATQALSIGVPVATTPHIALAAPVSPALGYWTADPRAVKLLASCAALPPAYCEHRQRYGNAVDRWDAYAGYRVEALEAIRMEVGDVLMQAYHRQGAEAWEPMQRWCEQPNASDAIAAVRAASTEH